MKFRLYSAFLAVCLPISSFAFTAGTPVGKCGKVLGYKVNGNQFWFKIDSDPGSYFYIQNNRTMFFNPNGSYTTMTDAQKIELRNAERSAIMQAYSLGESVCFLREPTSTWGAGYPYYEVENITVGGV